MSRKEWSRRVLFLLFLLFLLWIASVHVERHTGDQCQHLFFLCVVYEVLSGSLLRGFKTLSFFVGLFSLLFFVRYSFWASF